MNSNQQRNRYMFSSTRRSLASLAAVLLSAVSIGCTEGFIGEDMFFYAGPGALRRAQLAKKILEERFKVVKLDAEEVRIDFLGLNAMHGAMTPKDAPEPYEIAVRVAARTKTREEAIKVGREVDGMAVSGVGMTGKRVPHRHKLLV